MKPKFPNIPSGSDWIKRISPEWFSELKKFCEWAADHPRGDGRTILNQQGGILRATTSYSSGDGGSLTFPCFWTVLKADALSVSGGWLNRNGDFVEVPPVEGIKPKTGYLCLRSTPDDKGKWSDAAYVILDAPAADAYPVAKLKVADGAVSITCYPVTVAVILLTKVCPIAEI